MRPSNTVVRRVGNAEVSLRFTEQRKLEVAVSLGILPIT